MQIAQHSAAVASPAWTLSSGQAALLADMTARSRLRPGTSDAVPAELVMVGGRCADVTLQAMLRSRDPVLRQYGTAMRWRPRCCSGAQTWFSPLRMCFKRISIWSQMLLARQVHEHDMQQAAADS